MAPVGATYAVGDLMDLLAAKNVSGTTLQVAAQMRLPLCASLRSLFLHRSQTLLQWSALVMISLLCVASMSVDIGPGEFSMTAMLGDGLLLTMPLIMGKCFISCAGAVHAEYFLQHRTAQESLLWVTQVHFKMATMLGTIIAGVLQGRKGKRILATHWDGKLFEQLPPGMKAGDSRIPFFGGWDYTTWALVICLCFNNFLVGDALRRLTSVSKYVAYALGMVLTYSAQVLSNGGRDLDIRQACCCTAIALIAIAYIQLPGPSKEPQTTLSQAKGKASEVEGKGKAKAKATSQPLPNTRNLTPRENGAKKKD